MSGKTAQANTWGVAAVYVGPRKEMQVRSYPVLPPGKGEALLRMKCSGICGTDVHICEGRLALPGAAMILGHEFVGQVEALGKGVARDGLGSPLRAGDLAIASVALPCGKCFTCKQGETASCLNFGVTYLRDPAEPPHFFGGYAQYLFSPAANLVKVSKGINLDAVAAFPCAGPTILRALDSAGGLRKGELVVVQGAGPVGLFTVAYAAKSGCTVVSIASSSNPRRMKLAKKLGAKVVLDYRATSVEQRAKIVSDLAAKLKRGNGADVVIEASGSPAAIPEGLSLVRTLGRYIIPGQYSDSGQVSIAPQLITFKAIKIIGSGQYKRSDVGGYISFLRKHADIQRAFASCVTHKYEVSDANLALANAVKGVSVKGVFVG